MTGALLAATVVLTVMVRDDESPLSLPTCQQAG